MATTTMETAYKPQQYYLKTIYSHRAMDHHPLMPGFRMA